MGTRYLRVLETATLAQQAAAKALTAAGTLRVISREAMHSTKEAMSQWAP